MDNNPKEVRGNLADKGHEAFVALLVELYIKNQSRYEDQAKELLGNRLLRVVQGPVVIRYWIDDKGSYFKVSRDHGETFSNALSFFELSGSDEEKIQNLRDQFANSEARVKLGL